MAIDTIEVRHLDVFNSIVGGGLIFPKILTEPGGGVLSAHKGHFGGGSSVIPYSASLIAGPSMAVPPAIPTPLTWNFLGLGLETGVRNILGADIKIGTCVSMGALRMCYSVLKGSVVAREYKVMPLYTTTAMHQVHRASVGQLLGFWFHNNTPLACIHCSHSDIRIKKNITPYNNSLNTILKLNPISYEWRKELLPSDYLKIGHRKDGKQIGLIAQEVEEIIPEIVKDVQVTKDQSWKGIDYEKLTTVLIGAVKEQQTQIEELKERISVLESK